jgi:hypothetical protein
MALVEVLKQAPVVQVQVVFLIGLIAGLGP